ncbi:transposase [Bacillus thuringiensis serovar yunnanensis]|nr:transposase [Bacillus thuringiensis serovar yunnanensis]
MEKVKNMLCDGGYTGTSFAQVMKETLAFSVETIKRSELHKFVVLPKFWKKYELTLENSRQSYLLASVAILFK